MIEAILRISCDYPDCTKTLTDSRYMTLTDSILKPQLPPSWTGVWDGQVELLYCGAHNLSWK